MSRKFTKGEWKRRTGIWSEQVENEEGDLIFEVSRMCKTKEECEANLKLLLAAPKLLFWMVEHLSDAEDMVAVCDNDLEIAVVNEKIEQMRKIIKEAGYEVD